ncbi:hypothetical protein QL285_031448 [Trifolium repens]|nr:hypothetical protein QL285_031448 [Trifolium repens]
MWWWLGVGFWRWWPTAGFSSLSVWLFCVLEVLGFSRRLLRFRRRCSEVVGARLLLVLPWFRSFVFGVGLVTLLFTVVVEVVVCDLFLLTLVVVVVVRGGCQWWW